MAELADETSHDHILALDDAGLLYDDFFRRQSYLREMIKGFKPQSPPPPYDIRQDYQNGYEAEQARQQRIAREEETARLARMRAVTPRTEPKIGRNDPCPCGSGRKYKKCHGRPGVG